MEVRVNTREETPLQSSLRRWQNCIHTDRCFVEATGLDESSRRPTHEDGSSTREPAVGRVVGWWGGVTSVFREFIRNPFFCAVSIWVDVGSSKHYRLLTRSLIWSRTASLRLGAAAAGAENFLLHLVGSYRTCLVCGLSITGRRGVSHFCGTSSGGYLWGRDLKLGELFKSIPKISTRTKFRSLTGGICGRGEMR